MAMAALTRTRTEVPKRPAPAAGSPAAKRVRFSDNKMTLGAVSKDIFETFIEPGELLTSYGNPKTDDMGTHVADLIQKDLFDCNDYGTWHALVQRLHQTLTGGAYQDLPNFEKNKTFLEDEMGVGDFLHRTYREFMTFQTYLEPRITPEDMLKVARTLPGTATEWKPEDYPLFSDEEGPPAVYHTIATSRARALWYATIFHQVNTPRAAEYWPHDPAIMKDVETRYTKDDEDDEEATEKYDSPAAAPAAEGPEPSPLALGSPAVRWTFHTPERVFRLYERIRKAGTINPLALGAQMPDTFTEEVMVEIMGNYTAMMAAITEMEAPAAAPAPPPALGPPSLMRSMTVAPPALKRMQSVADLDVDPDQELKNAARAAYMSSK